MLSLVCVMHTLSLGRKQMDSLHSQLWRDLPKQDWDVISTTRAIAQRHGITPTSESRGFWRGIDQRIEELHAARRESHRARLLYVLSLLFTELPPRRNAEWQSMKMGNMKRNAIDSSNIHFRKFKSVLRDGHIQMPHSFFSEKLMRAMRLYMAAHPRLKQEGAFLLCSEDGEPFRKINSLTRLLYSALGCCSADLRRYWFQRFT